MVLRCTFPESAKGIDMDVNPVLPASTLRRTQVPSCGLGFLDFRSSWRLATLLSLLLLVPVLLSPGVLVDARSFVDLHSASEDGTVVAYVSRSVEGNPLLLRGNTKVGNQRELHFGHVLDFGRRRLLQTQPSNTTRPLAVRGDRRDPLNNFHKYRGGYDVKNKHYWASAIFTGVYGYAIAAALLVLGALFLLFSCCKLCCCRRQRSTEPHKSFYYWIPRVLVLLLSLFAIGCIVTLFIRNRQFHTQAFRVRDSISESANDATGAVRNVSSTLTTVNTLVSKYNISGLGQIDSTVTGLNEQADSITKDVDDNIRTINRLVNGIEIALIVILAVALVIIILGLVSTLMGWRAMLVLVIFLGWLLTMLTWVLFGVFFAVNNVTSDTCVALNEYLQAPANTTLDDLLPCVDLATASSASNIARQGVHNIALQANNTVAQVRQARARSGRNSTIPNVCDPIGPAPEYTYPTTCPAGTVQLGQLPQTLQPYVCSVEPLSNQCSSQGLVITPTQNTTIKDLSEAGVSLVTIIPTITSLTNCSFVYNTFNTIVTQRCSPTKSALRNLWIPLLLLSIALTLLTVAWILANHRNKKQHYAHIHAQDSPKRLRK